MRRAGLVVLLVLVTGCDERGRTPGGDQGVGDLGDVDLAAPGADLAAADLGAGADLTPPVCEEPSDGGLAPGERCSTAIPLTAGVTLMGQDNGAFSNDYDPGVNPSPACSGELTATYSGKDVAYAITIPAGKTLTVTVQHSNLNGMWYPAVALVTDCCRPGPSCLSGQDVVVPNANPRVVSHTNSGPAPLPVYVIVDSDFATASGEGEYTVTAQLN
jgi:hypothetical protein